MSFSAGYFGAKMTPHQVLSLMTQEQTAAVMIACLAYLPVERVFAGLLEGLEVEEQKALSLLLSEHLCIDEEEKE